MSRRRSTPWIHRWSRQLIGAIAILGALLTAYLTVVKLTGGTVVCTAGAEGAASSCNDVLSTPYAEVFGLPLTLFGCFAYVSMATFALAPLTVSSEQKKVLRSQLEDWTWLLLFAGAAAMAIFSGYLMYVLAFKIQAVCLYCIGSALFSLSMLVLTIIGRSWEDIGQLLFTGIAVCMVTLIGTLGVYANVGEPTASPDGAGTTIPLASGRPEPSIGGWKVTTTSGEAEIALALHLTKVGAKKYGAYWCPHCYEQKQLFGKEAFQEINYVECAEGGKDAQPRLCVAAEIKSYPTWEINGELLPGVQTLEELANLTDYQGLRDFKYSLPGG
ncbi:MAG: vitamin K epoxide reductase family protein [Symploca sp. SIO2B6]|nr:vitamin K epoxide reductase family protein [Symploca sp. SIO2B6]